VAGYGDGHVRDLALGVARIGRKGKNAFLIGGDQGGVELEVMPENLAVALAFGLQNLAVGFGDGNDEGDLLSGGDGGAFRKSGSHGSNRSLGKRRAPPQSDFDGSAGSQTQ